MSSIEQSKDPIIMIVGFPPGGSLDLTAQPLVEATNRLGLLPRSIEVTHIPGESGTIGMQKLLESPRDGSVLCMGAMGLLTLQPHLRDLPYRDPSDYSPIVGAVSNPACLAVRSDSPWSSIQELVEDASRRPGAIRVADLGSGSSLHLATEILNRTAGIRLEPTHLSGSPACVQALLDGEVECVTNHHAVFPEHVAAGTIRVLGVFEQSRNKLFPDTQTFVEAGHDVVFDSYACVIGPPRMDSSVVAELHEAFSRAMKDSRFAKSMETRGLTDFDRPPEELANRLAYDLNRNGEVVEAVGLSV